ncbi:MAG: hypothetical protein IH986_03465 [Planctomycetes bacterium]|nr:hypothetical protein [Planctomycetota bacterium]
MSFEVHSGTKPGRPVLMLALSSGVLFGTLGLAWLQVFEAHALGPEIRIENSPLVVRVPKGWKQLPNDPTTFVLPVRQREAQVIQRSITFEYMRLSSFRSPAEIAAQMAAPNSPPPQATHIGPFDAVQLLLPPRQVTFWQRDYSQPELCRIACTPRGELIRIRYVALTDLSSSDIQQLDDICDAVRLDDDSLSVAPDEAMQRAGVQFDRDADWIVIGPDTADVAGLHIGGSLGGVPAWSISVFRTWLAAGRTAEDLLSDAAHSTWIEPIDETRFGSQQRSDGMTILTARHAEFSSEFHPVTLVRILAASPSDALLLFVCAGPAAGQSAAAFAAVERVTGSLEFAATSALPSIADAEIAGREMIERLDWADALSAFWGREFEQAFYSVRGAQGDSLHSEHHAAQDHAGGTGYKGGFVSLSDTVVRKAIWTLDADGAGYEYTVETRADQGTARTLSERRAPGEDEVTRSVVLGGMRRTSRFQVGPTYICPPAESIIEWLVASRAEGACLIEASTRLGRGAHSRLLRPLPVDERGRRRVLLQMDYKPAGIVLGFDEMGRWQYQHEPSWRMERISRAQAERLSKDRRRFRLLLPRRRS